jgi:anti-anti-sigma factor
MQDPPRGRAPLQFQLEEISEPPRTTLRLAGELDSATVPQLEVAFERAVQTDDEEIVVDLERLTFIDSTGLQAFVAAHRRFDGDGPSLLVRRPSNEVARVFTLVGLDKLLRIVED